MHRDHWHQTDRTEYRVRLHSCGPTPAAPRRCEEIQNTIFQGGAVRGKTEPREGRRVSEQRPVSLERGNVYLELRDGDEWTGSTPERDGRRLSALVQGRLDAEAGEGSGEG